MLPHPVMKFASVYDNFGSCYEVLHAYFLSQAVRDVEQSLLVVFLVHMEVVRGLISWFVLSSYSDVLL